MSINLSPKSEELIEAMLKSGRFASAEEAVETALAAMQFAEDTEAEYEYPDLAAKVQEGLDAARNGDFVDGETFMAELISEIEERAARKNQTA